MAKIKCAQCDNWIVVDNSYTPGEDALCEKCAFPICTTCGGSGEVHSHNPKCWDCDGTGEKKED